VLLEPRSVFMDRRFDPLDSEGRNSRQGTEFQGFERRSESGRYGTTLAKYAAV